MARRRKSDAKAPEKTPAKPVAVRKSTRQIAKKQLQEKKVNGQIVQGPRSTDSEESCGASQEERAPTVSKKTTTASPVVHKKFGKYRYRLKQDKDSTDDTDERNNTGDDDNTGAVDDNDSTSVADDNDNTSTANDNDNTGAADDNDNTGAADDNDNTGAADDNDNTGVDSQPRSQEEPLLWQEDVIEETIICEEMEVEEGDENYTIAEDGSVVLEQMLLVNEDYEPGDAVVEFTVIENQDDGESRMLTGDVEEPAAAKAYEEVLEDGVSGLRVCEEESAPGTSCCDAEFDLGKSDEEPASKDEESESPESVCETPGTSTDNEPAGEAEDSSGTLDNLLPEKRCEEDKKNSDSGESTDYGGNGVEKRIDDSMLTESCDDLTGGCADGGTGDSLLVDKGEQEESAGSILDEAEEKLLDEEEEKIMDEAEEKILDEAERKFDREENKSDAKGERSERGQNCEELSGDSEAERKVEIEDIKLSSSSENSSDTLLSMNSCKIPELGDIKSIPGQQSESEKKPGFRSRSGSTDTTGSESGSNSSGVRRSSRIRTIGLMKQRSRGRGLVTKPNLDLSRSIFQHDRDKSTNGSSSVCSQESKDNSDNQSETQSDKESSSNKTATSADSPAHLSAPAGSTGYESDTSKPVKVKSRWRRSSELEMGGTGLLKVQTPEGDPGVEAALVAGSPSAGTGSLTPPVCKMIGARISLPMVPEMRDREMEERLSQFEHLRENMYLTERYTNKETKRMVCDCFLTDEEITRGELGCGEDCLNRLLMIECGSRCVVSDRCTNKRFQNCEYAKCEVFRTEKKGFGLRAVADLPAGEFIMEYVGEVVDPKDFRRRAKDYSKDKNRHYYFMALKSDQIIDATMKGNISRFINHSCDPNSETQKWTVNGELRIGFFNKKFIAAGDEITFDYHFQRYGKEAQKCFCEAENCRGWIGETPEEEKEKEKVELKEEEEKDIKEEEKKEEKIPLDYMEDEDLEEEIDKLCSGGLKNRAHTLNLSRLMVRSRELEHRSRLLRLIRSGEQPCRRLFLDYHGLRLIWSYMMDIAASDTTQSQEFRLEILRTLNTLPIPNKTMLMDSKVYGVVEKWSKRVFLSPTGGSPEDDKIEEPDSSCDVEEGEGRRTGEVVEKEAEGREVKREVEEEREPAVDELAGRLLGEWSNLKEVFRIPKKERIEQMKEHEREADRGYREDLEKEERREKSYDRHRYSRSDPDKRSDRRRGRDSPDNEYSRSKEKRTEERANLVPIPRMSKYERRKLFAMRVAKEEEEERQRRQQQESWQEHAARCMALGMDPHTSAALDPQTGYALFFNPSMGQWQPYPMQDTAEIQPACPMYIGGPPPLPGHPQSPMLPPTPHILPLGVPPPIYPPVQATPFNPPYPVLPPPQHHQQFPTPNPLQLPSNLIPIQNGTPPAAPPVHPIYQEEPTEPTFPGSATPVHPEGVPAPPVLEVPALDLPPKWKWAKDARGRIYYYHAKERVSQWLPPPPDHIGCQPDSEESSDESSEESSSEEEEEEEMEEEGGDEETVKVDSAMEVDGEIAEALAGGGVAEKVASVAAAEETLVPAAEPKKRRDGLVQERIISPRREEERIDHRKYKEIKEKLRRQKEKAKLKEQVEKQKKHRRSGKSKSHSRHSASKLHALSSDPSSTLERKIKDTFRINMANVMVHFLNPYRKTDCKQGRITNTEDFKHLARKLTHFVLAKELKHCKSVDELQCNDNVKHKAKDFVRKYMSKFGAVYQKATDED